MMRAGISQVSGQQEFPEDLEENVVPVFDRGTGVMRKMVHMSGEALSPQHSPKLQDVFGNQNVLSKTDFFLEVSV